MQHVQSEQMAAKSEFNRLFGKHLKAFQERSDMRQEEIGKTINPKVLSGASFLQNAKANPRSVPIECAERFIKLVELSKADAEELRDAWFSERLVRVAKWGEAFDQFVQDSERNAASPAKFQKSFRDLRDRMMDKFA